MVLRSQFLSSVQVWLLGAVVTVLLLSVSVRLNAAESALAAPLCSVLKETVPQVRSFQPEGARAQLVMAIAEKFDADANKLRQVKTEIDQVTTATCPKEREEMLQILKMKSLAEAVS